MKRYLLLAAILLLMPFAAATAQDAARTTALRHLDAQRTAMKLTEADLADVHVTDQYTDRHSGVTHVYLRQRYQGIEVHQANVGVHVGREGEVVHWNGRFVPRLAEKINATAPSLRAVEAVEAAARDLNLALTEPLEVVVASKGGADERVVLSKGGLSFNDIPARLVYHVTDRGEVRLAWNVEIYELDQQHYWNMRVDALSGQVLDKEDWVVHDTWGPAREAEPAAGAPFAPGLTPAGPLAALAPAPGAASAQYRIYPIPIESPRHAGPNPNSARFNGNLRALVTESDQIAKAGPLAATNGWHNDGAATYQITRGNNVWAYEDTHNSGVPPTGGDPVVAGASANGGASGNFDFVLDLTTEPTLEVPVVGPQNQSAVITNLFYMNNIMHDVFYRYGFNEASGNMQEVNFGRGGAGSDAVRAEAQDGSGANNANMLTPTDGNNPRMQMFLWPQTNGDPTIDGDLDNGVIAHEYGHSISIRMTGGPSTNCLNGGEQAGEGWSDYFGLMLTMRDPATGAQPGPRDRGIGTYVLNQNPSGRGIRPTKYSPNFAVNATTYGDIGGLSQPHGVGYAFATILWDMTWNLIDAFGFNPNVYVPGTDPSAGGNNIALQLVIDGIKMQPCGPTFTASRDAILAADRVLFPENNPGTPDESLHERLIWSTFARRGVGWSADAGSNAKGDEVEAFDLPPKFRNVLEFDKSAPATVGAGGTLPYTLTATNRTGGTLTGVTITDNVPAGTAFSAGSATCSNGAPGGEAGGVVTFGPFSMGDDEVVVCSFSVDVAATPFSTFLFTDALEAGDGNWATTTTVGLAGDEWMLQTANPHSGTHAWFVRDPDNFSDQELALVPEVNLSGNAHLRFWHHYSTEAGFDGGVVEISSDGGATWQDLGPFMVQEGYNGFIPLVDTGFPPLPNTSPLVERDVFAGGSGGYVQTIADLTSFVGDDVRIRFRFAADVATPAVGWYVDDVEFLDLYSIPNQACVTAASVGTICDDLGLFGTIVLPEGLLQVNARIALEGAYDAGASQMHADLNAAGDLPTTQPFGEAAFAGTPMEYGGGERVGVTFFAEHPEIVDWVLVDLRTSADPNDRVARRAALLRQDGVIVDTDGVSPVGFAGVTAGDHFVVVRHRNHLPVMSASAAQVVGDVLSFDFTTGAGQAAGFQPMKELAPGVFGLYAGDADADGQIQNDDKNVNWRGEVGQAGYKSADFNLNGQVQNDDKNLYWRPNAGRGTAIDS